MHVTDTELFPLINHALVSQNASAGVSRMLLGNKCDIESKRKVSKETGEKVSWSVLILLLWIKTALKQIKDYCDVKLYFERRRKEVFVDCWSGFRFFFFALDKNQDVTICFWVCLLTAGEGTRDQLLWDQRKVQHQRGRGDGAAGKLQTSFLRQARLIRVVLVVTPISFFFCVHVLCSVVISSFGAGDPPEILQEVGT